MGALRADSQQAFAQPPDPRKERSGLSKVMWFGVIQLVGLAVGGAFALYIIIAVFSSIATLAPSFNQTYGAVPTSPPINETSRAFAALGPVFHNLLLFYPVSIVIDLAAISLLTLGFRDLGKADRARFSTPSTFMLVLIAGTFISAAGGLLLFSNFSNLLSMSLASHGPPPSAESLALVGSFFLGVIVAITGGIIGIIGFVGGTMLGLWRLGSRYDETTLKIAAIFMIIPLLDIISPILVIVGTVGARNRLVLPQ